MPNCAMRKNGKHRPKRTRPTTQARDRLTQAIADPACRSCHDGGSRRGCRRWTRLRHERSRIRRKTGSARRRACGWPPRRTACLDGSRPGSDARALHELLAANALSPNTFDQQLYSAAVKTFDTLKLIDTSTGIFVSPARCSLQPLRSPLRQRGRPRNVALVGHRDRPTGGQGLGRTRLMGRRRRLQSRRPSARVRQ